MTRRRLSVVLLLVTTAVLYLWNLGANGWANDFYAAAVQAGSSSWKAMLFGSSDAANLITVDKTPASLWVMDLAARLFGFSSWSMLIPQALEGVAAVGLMYATVRRTAGHGAGLLAGTVMALTPVAALMFRFNNPDALLVLLLLAAAYSVLRAIEPGSSAWWMPLAGTAIGFGFLAKMLQAFLVLPVFGLMYLIAAHAPLRTRLIRSVTAALALVVSGGWYLALVALWPADSRPYIGGSQHNSVMELALGYNGVGRLTGEETGGLGNMNFDVGWNRLFASGMGGHIAWLIPSALIFAVAALWLTRRAPRTDPTRAAATLWLGWLTLTGAVFSYMNGIVHAYYTVMLAPAIAGCVGIGATLLWRRRADIRAAVTLAATLVVTVVVACVLLARTPDWQPWLRPTIAVAGVGGAVLLLVAGRLSKAVTTALAALALAAGLAAPAAYAVQTAATPHTGVLPAAGPAGGHGGGLFRSPAPTADLVALLTRDAVAYTWTAAAVGSSNAAGYQLATGTPVMALGGFNGTDPAPTLAEFQHLVAEHKVHYFIDTQITFGRGTTDHGGSDAATEIATWVTANFTPTVVDGTTVYRLDA